jgi:hypothetical protein
MRKSFWIGLILLVVGLIVALSSPSYVEDTDSIGIGDAKVTIQDRDNVPSWIGWATAGVGLVVMVNGLRGRGGRNIPSTP